jgi:hypothetical protein
VKLDFTRADKERRRQVTTAQVGYANKATGRQETTKDSNKENKPNTTSTGPSMAYCWSHGYGNNASHSSKTCTNPLPGHRTEATVDNMLGGCCVIKRRMGERAIYKRPVRALPTDQPPAEK